MDHAPLACSRLSRVIGKERVKKGVFAYFLGNTVVQVQRVAADNLLQVSEMAARQRCGEKAQRSRLLKGKVQRLARPPWSNEGLVATTYHRVNYFKCEWVVCFLKINGLWKGFVSLKKS